MWSYNVFARKLTLYFIGVYIINYNILNSTTSKGNLLRTSVVIAGVADGIGSMSALFQSKLFFFLQFSPEEKLTWLKFILTLEIATCQIPLLSTISSTHKKLFFTHEALLGLNSDKRHSLETVT